MRSSPLKNPDRRRWLGAAGCAAALSAAGALGSRTAAAADRARASGSSRVLVLYFKETMIDARGTACKHCYGGFAVRQPSRNNSGIKGKDLDEKTDSRLYGHAVGTGNRLMVA